MYHRVKQNTEAQQHPHGRNVLLGVMFHALKKRLGVSATVAEINKRCHSRINNHPQGKAGNKLIKLLGCFHICDVTDRDASGY